MISTDLKRVKLQSIVENQLPSFVQSDFPLLGEFLREYYTSQEYPTASADILQNIDEYVKLVTLTTNTDSTVLRYDIDEVDEEIFASFDFNIGVMGTYQFPDQYGLIKIDNEIILYKEKTNNSFKGCIRGFSGVTSYNSIHSDQLTFSESDIAEHVAGAKIVNCPGITSLSLLTALIMSIPTLFNSVLISALLNLYFGRKGTSTCFVERFSFKPFLNL